MASITWPLGLPQRMRIDGYNESVAEGTIRTSMDEGPAKARKLPTRDYDKVSGSILINSTQWTDVKKFYKDTTGGGALRFDWVDQVTGDADIEYRFVKPPTLTPYQDSQLFLARLELEKSE